MAHLLFWLPTVAAAIFLYAIGPEGSIWMIMLFGPLASVALTAALCGVSHYEFHSTGQNSMSTKVYIYLAASPFLLVAILSGRPQVVFNLLNPARA